MNGKDFREFVNKFVKDDDSIALMWKHHDEDCLFAMKEEYIRRKNDGENDMVVFSVKDFE
jgi:ABC-type iron transport system FetAB ATPase subunit